MNKNTLDSFTDADDMVSSVREEFVRNLYKSQKKVNAQKAQLDKQIQWILKEIKKPTESYSLLSEHIAKSIRLNPDEKTVVILTNAQNLINEFNRIKTNTVQADNSIIESLEEEYNSKWKGTVCDRYMAHYFIKRLAISKAR